MIGIIAFAALLILLGVGLIAYPYISDYYSRLSQAKVTHSQDRIIAETPVEDLTAEFDHTRDFNDRLIAGRVVVTDPFDPNNVTPTDAEYESVLNLAGDGVMGTIAIPKIDVFLPIYHGVEGEGMEHGVGHMPSTTLPVGGPSTHAGLAGHTGLPSARIFDSLTKIHRGDWFILTILGQDMAYEVVSTEVVLPDETESLHVVEGEDLVTLITCTPYGVNTHRLLVHGQRCPIPNEWLKLQETVKRVPLIPQTVAETPKFIFTVLGLIASLGLLAAWAVILRNRRKYADEDEAETETPPSPLRPIPTRFAPSIQPVAPSQQITPERRHAAGPRHAAAPRHAASAALPTVSPAPDRRTAPVEVATPPAAASKPRHARHAAPASSVTQQATTPRHSAAPQRMAATPRHHASPASEPRKQVETPPAPRKGAHFRSSTAAPQAPATRAPQAPQPTKPTQGSRRGAHFRR